MRRVACVLTVFVSSIGNAQSSDLRFEATVALTRNSQATYALVSRNVVTPRNAEMFVEWSAEFHQDDRHRVETPRDRLVANCRTSEGSHLNVDSGEITHGDWIAKAACGINANKDLKSKIYRGTRPSAFGDLTLVEMTDDESLRTYSVNPQGALAEATISDLDGTPLLRAKAVSLVGTLPAGDIFSESSLQRSVVSPELKALGNGH